jgi:phosphoribosylanthranilate isomerase
MTRVKFCGLCHPEDARRAADLGADYLGVILAPGFSRTRPVGEAARIYAAGGAIARVGVFVDQDVAAVARIGEQLALSVLQLHGGEAPEVVAERRAAGRWRVWKAIRPRSADEFVSLAERHGATADAILVDGWSPKAAGGTGASFPWEAVGRERGRLPGGVGLVAAGGLTPENVGRLVAAIAPDVVDVSSGVEDRLGRKSAARLEAFIAAVRSADPTAAAHTGE